jgi:hypothetical protein
MGGRGQGVRRGRSELRGKVNNGRYDKVRSGGGGVLHGETGGRFWIKPVMIWI